MNGRERGFLLLTSHLGDPGRKVLTAAQFRELTKRMLAQERPVNDRDVQRADLMALGYSAETAGRICHLLSQEDVLQDYISRGRRKDCIPLSRTSDGYPRQLRRRLGLDSPGVLWCMGDISILERPCVALVGSRQLRTANREFAAEVGTQAAKQGFVLVSGNAKGADITAQQACLRAGGQVISVVADALQEHRQTENILYISEDGFDLDFTPQRALSRNRVIHALAERTFVAQCTLGKGGTWDGTCNNLRYSWSPVFCFGDGTQAMLQLEQMGAVRITLQELANIRGLAAPAESFLDP